MIRAITSAHGRQFTLPDLSGVYSTLTTISSNTAMLVNHQLSKGKDITIAINSWVDSVGYRHTGCALMFIDTDWELKRFHLGCLPKRLGESQPLIINSGSEVDPDSVSTSTSENIHRLKEGTIHQQVTELFKKMSVPMDQVCHIVTSGIYAQGLMELQNHPDREGLGGVWINTCFADTLDRIIYTVFPDEMILRPTRRAVTTAQLYAELVEMTMVDEGRRGTSNSNNSGTTQVTDNSNHAAVNSVSNPTDTTSEPVPVSGSGSGSEPVVAEVDNDDDDNNTMEPEPLNSYVGDILCGLIHHDTQSRNGILSWWCLWHICDTLISQRNEITTLYRNMQKDIPLLHDDWELLQILVIVIKPFVLAQQFFEEESSVTVSYLPLLLSKIRQGLKFILHEYDSEVTSKSQPEPLAERIVNLVSQVLREFDRCFVIEGDKSNSTSTSEVQHEATEASNSKQVNSSTSTGTTTSTAPLQWNIPDSALMAAALDPRTKYLSGMHVKQVSTLWKGISNLLMATITHQDEHTDTTDNVDDDQGDDNNVTGQCGGESTDGTSQSKRKSESITTIKKEILAFSEVPQVKHSPETPTNPLLWWKEHCTLFPHIASLARRFLAVPPTATDLKKLYTVSGSASLCMRKACRDRHIDAYINLEENWDLVSSGITVPTKSQGTPVAPAISTNNSANPSQGSMMLVSDIMDSQSSASVPVYVPTPSQSKPVVSLHHDQNEMRTFQENNESSETKRRRIDTQP